MTENQSLDGTASSSAAFFKCFGAARQFNWTLSLIMVNTRPFII
jgi:hypothetical protein